MENRRPVHYEGNTVENKFITKADLKHNRKRHNRQERRLIPTYDKKTYASTLCGQCGNRSPDYRAICRFCGSCMSCGLKSDQRNFCRFCGNKQPAGTLARKVKRTIRA